MATTIHIHYRGSKARAFYAENDVPVYLRDFVYADLDALGLPRPKVKECVYTAQSGLMKCRYPRPSFERAARLAAALDAILPVSLDAMSISMVRMISESTDGSKPRVLCVTATDSKRRGRDRTTRTTASARTAHPYDRSGRPSIFTPASTRTEWSTLPGQWDGERTVYNHSANTFAVSSLDLPHGALRGFDGMNDTQGHRIDSVLERLSDIHSNVAGDPSSWMNTAGRPANVVFSPATCRTSEAHPEAPPPHHPSPERSLPPDPSSTRTTEPTVKMETCAGDGPSLLRRLSDAAETSVKPEPRQTDTPPPPTGSSPATSAPSSIFSAGPTSSGGTSDSALSSEPTADDVQRELQDLRERMSALAAREGALMKQLEYLRGSSRSEPLSATQLEDGHEEEAVTRNVYMGTAEQSPEDTRDSELEYLRAQLEKALAERRAAAYALYREHQCRVAAENAFADVRRECSAAFVVPALMEALIEISALTDAVPSDGGV